MKHPILDKEVQQLKVGNKLAPMIKVKVKANTVVLSKDLLKNCVFILFQGSVNQYVEVGGKSFLNRKIIQKGFFGFESFLPSFDSVFITDEDSVVSIYPLPELVALFKSNQSTYLSYMDSLRKDVDEWVNLANIVIQHANRLCLFNKSLATFIKLREVELDIEESWLEEYETEEDETTLSSFMISNWDVHLKYQPTKANKEKPEGLLIGELFSPILLDDFTRILKKSFDLVMALQDTLLGKWYSVQQDYVKALRSLFEEYEIFFNSNTSILKKIFSNKTEFEKLSSGESQLLDSLFKMMKKELASNDFYQTYLEVYEVIPYLKDVGYQDSLELEDDSDAAVNEDEIDESKTEEGDGGEKEKNEIEADKGGVVDFSENQTEITNDDIKFLKSLSLNDAIEREDIAKVQRINKKFMHQILYFAIQKNVNEKSLTSKENFFMGAGVISKDLLKSKYIVKVEKYLKSHKDTDIVFSLEHWLERVADEREIPSNDVLGNTYRKYLMEKKKKKERRSQLMRKKSKSKDELEDKEVGANLEVKSRLSFEVLNAISTNMGMFSPNKSHIYGLNDKNFFTEVNSYWMTPKFIKATLDGILKIDPKLFYRETVYTSKKEGIRKLIEMEVLPVFIILPTVGRRVVCWQDITENNKKSSARFFVPMIFQGDFRKMLVSALAGFRWELCRTVRGTMWQDPVEGGITGIYTDYINFYKKNTFLSKDIKEKVAKFIKDHRKNQKNMFCDNYYDWVENESRGVLRLNPYIRDLFFLHMPFGKEAREKIKNLPAFEGLVRMFKLRQAKEIDLLSRQYKKFRDENNQIPDVLQKHIDSLSL